MLQQLAKGQGNGKQNVRGEEKKKRRKREKKKEGKKETKGQKILSTLRPIFDYGTIILDPLQMGIQGPNS